MKHLRFILGILLTLVVVILLVENHEAMTTEVTFKADFVLFHLESSKTTLYFIVTIAFLFGIFISGLYGIIERFRLKKQIRILINATREKDNELNSLRNLPLTSDNVGAGRARDSIMEAEEEEF